MKMQGLRSAINRLPYGDRIMSSGVIRAGSIKGFLLPAHFFAIAQDFFALAYWPRSGELGSGRFVRVS